MLSSIVFGIVLIVACLLLINSRSTTISEALYSGKSKNWEVTIRFTKEGNHYIENPTVKYIGNEKVSELQVEINYKGDNGNFNPSNTIKKINYFNVNEVVPLVTKNKVPNYKNLKNVILRWHNEVNSFEEGIVLSEVNVH